MIEGVAMKKQKIKLNKKQQHEYYGSNVPLFRRNGYRQSGTMIPGVRNRDTTFLIHASLLA